MIDDKTQDAIMEAYEKTILVEYKKSPDFKKAYQKMIKAVHDAWSASDTIDSDDKIILGEAYSELKKISKQMDMLTIKLSKAKII